MPVSQAKRKCKGQVRTDLPQMRARKSAAEMPVPKKKHGPERATAPAGLDA